MITTDKNGDMEYVCNGCNMRTAESIEKSGWKRINDRTHYCARCSDSDKSLDNCTNLDKLIAYWQPILRVADWRITISYAPRDHMPGKYALANAFFDLSHKTAKIQILQESDFVADDHGVGYSPERSLVYALLQLHFIEINPTANTLEYRALEVGINMIATTLMELKHASN